MTRNREPDDERPETDIEPIARLSPSAVPTAATRLERVAGGWLNDRADLFDPDEWERMEEHRIRLKAFNEVSMDLLLADQLPVDPAANTAAIRSLVVDRVNDRWYHHALRRNPGDVRKYAFPVLFAKFAGELQRDGLWETLGECLASEDVWAADRRPYAYLDLWVMAALYGIEPPAEPNSILRPSSLTLELHPIRSEHADAYPLTHNVMFYRGLGLNGFGFPSPPGPYDVRHSHVGLILRFLAERMYDPMIELLWTGILERQIPPDLVGICLQRLVAEIEEHGYVPDYSIDDGRIDSLSTRNVEALDHRGDRAVDWGAHYHVNAVAHSFAITLRAEWPELLDTVDDRPTPNYDPETLLVLGEAINDFAHYDLESGAKRLRQVAGTPAAEAYPTVFETAVSFLRDQRRDDGEFGYWSKEQRLFERLGFDADQFEDRFVAPTTEVCADALSAIDTGE